ncbi:ABC transporter permease [Macrococcus sp. DPC7161]|uniref:ABC transporter permease n=1 Tax=Macrococcus sp. DPC7161 TaxID=2507060 RepID=UPI0013E94543|nr:ABC transporter permease [Macrococcus sp. DPC7161]
MNKARQLFLNRNQRHQKEMMYYSKFVFNGHFVVFLSIFFGALMLQYSQLIKHLGPGINYHLIIGVLLCLAILAPLKTHMKRADEIYLLNFEGQMQPYFQSAIVQSFFKRIGLLVALFLILLPLNINAPNFSKNGTIIVFVSMIIILYLGLCIKGEMLKLSIKPSYINIVIFVISLAGIYTALEGIIFTPIVSVVMFIALLYLLKKNTKDRLMDFSHIIQYEENLTQNTYQMINMFTDVKGMKGTAKRRKVLDVFLRTKPQTYNHQHMFKFLFVRNFLRSNDSLWIIVRLLIIAICAMYFLKHPYISAIFGCFFVYVMILQSSQFYKQQAFGLWPQVWPVQEQLVIKGFNQFLTQLSLTVTIILMIAYMVICTKTFYIGFIMILIMLWTKHQVTQKIYKKMHLLKD